MSHQNIMFDLGDFASSAPAQSKADLYEAMRRAPREQVLSPQERREQEIRAWHRSLPKAALCQHGCCLEIEYCEVCEG